MKARTIGLLLIFIMVLVAILVSVKIFFLKGKIGGFDTEGGIEATEAYEILFEAAKIEAVPYKYIVVINPAHGGSDRGVVVSSGQNAINEADLVLEIAKLVKSMNGREDIGILLTRDGNTNPSMTQRSNFVDFFNPDIVIDLHLSKDSSKDTLGVESYYRGDYYRYDITNEELAHIMEQAVATAEGSIALGLTDISLDNSREYDFIRDKKVPSVAISCGYISSEIEGEYLIREDYLRTIATGILTGIMEVLNQ